MRIKPRALVFCAAFFPLLAPAQTEKPVNYCGNPDLDQGWTCEQREDFWFRSQGSRMLPYTWFLHLELAGSTDLFRSQQNMDALRFVTAASSAHNPDGLPVGFARDPSNCSGEDCWVGFTCAACHTARMQFKDVTLVIDGAPGMLDFTSFLEGLVHALEATRDDPSKFARFAANVLGPSPTPDQRNRLHKELAAQTAELKERANTNHPTYPYGFARVDAFGHIFNQVLAHDLDVPKNAVTPTAPVSYPCLWDTPQHDRVQWNGSAPNHFPGNPLFRNIGEVVGVFGTVEVTPKPGRLPNYRSSISPNLDNLRTLETLVAHLSSPLWPRNIVKIDDAAAARGKKTYQALCKDCHKILANRKKLHRHIKAHLDSVGTDPLMASNFATRRTLTGPLKGTPFPVVKFGDCAPAIDILTNVIFGVFLNGGGPFKSRSLHPRDRAFQGGEKLVYKARPLNGVWATAPYLHNGSIANLWELLSGKRSDTFQVGSRTFDPSKVGYDGSGSFTLDTSLPGNYKTGHVWGNSLTDSQRWDLIEFLKTL